ncbi:hypothetical protein CCP3SC1_120001 [Gammaproteobacteria bacterium]
MPDKEYFNPQFYPAVNAQILYLRMTDSFRPSAYSPLAKECG